MILRTAVMSFLSISLFFVAINLHSEELDGSARIKISGKVAQGISTSITVKEIELAGISDMEINDPFDNKTIYFTGVWLKDFIAKFGADGVKAVTFKAIDDYEISFSVNDWTGTRILLVTRISKKYFNFEHKGPVRIVFPDYDPQTDNSKEVLPKWIWMIKNVEFR